jgi:hypothetical protein
MPANLTTLAHFSVSSAMNFPNSLGEPPNTVAPRFANCAFSFGSARPALMSLLSLSMMSAVVFLGAPAPNQSAHLVARQEFGHRRDIRISPQRFAVVTRNGSLLRHSRLGPLETPKWFARLPALQIDEVAAYPMPVGHGRDRRLRSLIKDSDLVLHRRPVPRRRLESSTHRSAPGFAPQPLGRVAEQFRWRQRLY